MSTPAEIAPSETAVAEPTFARAVGALGLGSLLLGVIAIIANQYGPRLVGTSGGAFCALIGAALLLYHAYRDGDYEFRRAYMALGYLITAIAVIAGGLVLAGNEGGKVLTFKNVPILSGSGALFPPIMAMFALALLNAVVRHETSAGVRNTLILVWLGLGTLCCGGAVIAGLAQPDLLVGPGVVMALVGLAYFGAFFSQADTTQGIGLFAANALGLVGIAAVAYALAKSIWPTVLYEGPRAISDTLQHIDPWKLIGRLIAILAFLGCAYRSVRSKHHGLALRAAMVAIGLTFTGVFVYGCFGFATSTPPPNYFIPFGLLLALIGVLYLAVSLACVSDSELVTLTRREIGAYFVSPIAYILLIGSALMASFGYASFLAMFDRVGALPEPILQSNISLEIIAAITTLFIVPALTMRTFSEERRTATLEMLLTAPTSEWAIVFSKFLACWLMYLLTFAPAGLYLIGLRAEASQPFDYRPLLSYYLAVALCGVAFIGMGLFASALTSNQIIAAVLSFAGMLFFLICFVLAGIELNPALTAVLTRLDFLSFWRQSLSGLLPVASGVTFLSLGVFWLFLTVKALEARKWG